MARTDFPQEWQEWVAHNVQRGCSTTDIFNTLVREGRPWMEVAAES